jgi:uncharacterized protein YjiS (DUF1127 family)
MTMKTSSRYLPFPIFDAADDRRRPGPRRWGWRLFARLRGFLIEFRRAVERERAARHAIIELSELDDHMLRDLGITRIEIEQVVRRRPTLRIGPDEMLSQHAGPT